MLPKRKPRGECAFRRMRIEKNRHGLVAAVLFFLKNSLLKAKNSIEYKCVFLEYRSPELHRTHTQVFAKWNGKWCEAPDNTSPVLFGENGYDSAEACISAFTGLFRAYLEHELGEKYDENRLLVKEFRNTVVSRLTDEEYLSIARSN